MRFPTHAKWVSLAVILDLASSVSRIAHLTMRETLEVELALAVFRSAPGSNEPLPRNDQFERQTAYALQPLNYGAGRARSYQTGWYA